MFLFGCYLVVAGSALVLAPVLTASILGFQSPEEGGGFMRVTGMLALNLAYMCFVSARTESKDFMRWSVLTRSANFFLVWPFVALGNKVFLIFGVLDLVGAQWTRWAMARDREAGQVDRTEILSLEPVRQRERA
jgi:hypothetical protein